MQLYDEISGPNDQNLTRLSKDLNLSNSETSAVIKSVLPEIRINLERRTLSRGGLADIIQSLGKTEQHNYLAPEADLAAPPAIAQGDQLLGEILETKYRSRALADRAARETGVPAEKIRAMLPRIANLSMAALSQQTRPGLEDIFKRLPSIQTSNRNSPFGTGASTSSTGSPLPLPDDNWGGRGGAGMQDHNRYNDLSDDLRRRQGPLQSNPLWNIARQIIGSAFGFQSKGILGYIIRFIVYRYGWSIVRMLLGRFIRI